jgi:type II secretory pathway pseudopilin PulG
LTVIEILVAIAVMGIVGALILTTMSRQQRLLRAAAEQVEMRESVRDAISVLAEEVRGASARDTVRLMSDSAIEFFSALGSSVICASPSSSSIALAPVSASGISLTSWLAAPDTGDLALIYGSASSSTPGIWQRHRIVASESRSTQSVCPPSSGLSGVAGVSPSTLVLTLSPSPVAPAAGSPLRFIRRGRYSLYRSSDGRWYLGYRRCNAIGVSVCGAIQPVSGYYRPFNRDTSRTGIFFRFLDTAGQTIAPSDALRLARVQIAVRATSAVGIPLDRDPKNAADSTAISATLRNIP